MADPTLDQMIDALDKRKAAQPVSFLDVIKQLLFPKAQAPVNQPLPAFNAQGQPKPPTTLNDLLNGNAYGK